MDNTSLLITSADTFLCKKKKIQIKCYSPMSSSDRVLEWILKLKSKSELLLGPAIGLFILVADRFSLALKFPLWKIPNDVRQ